MKALVLLESSNAEVKGNFFENFVFAYKLGIREIHAVVLHPLTDVSMLQKAGCSRVYQPEQSLYPNYESVIALLEKIPVQEYQVLIALGSTFGREMMPYVAGRYDCAVVNEIIEVITPGDSPVFLKPMWAGKAFAEVQVQKGALYGASPRVNVFNDKSLLQPAASCDVQKVSLTFSPRLQFVEEVRTQSQGLDLLEASVVISGGRSLGSRENFKILESLSKVIPQSTVGASRAAVDSGYADHSQQVGQTGKTVSPKLYFAVGISGAIQHLAGMRTSGCIVAINTDPNAPIMAVADYALIGDLFEVVPLLEAELKSSDEKAVA